MRGRPATMQNRNLIDLRWIVRTVIRIPRHARDFLNQFHTRCIALAEDGVAAGQARAVGNVFGDKKL